MKTIAKNKLPELFNLIGKDTNLYVPAEVEGIQRFAPWEEGLSLYFSGNTLMPPKDILFPQTEKMYRFKAKGKTVEIEELSSVIKPIVIFGARSCDIQSIECLDKVFLTKGYEDDFYKEKRERTLLISLGCNSPADTCFCSSMGLDPVSAPGADIQGYDLGEKIGLVAKTPAGEEFMSKYSQLFTDEDATIPNSATFITTADMAGVTEKLSGMFESPIWEEISKKCIGCNACAYLCPTCHCFDMSRTVKGEQGTKFRTWDSCMCSEYTMMAGGHQPRAGNKERVRNRFLHKLLYFPQRYEQLLCTGCGRCIAKCPVGMDITSIISKVKEEIS